MNNVVDDLHKAYSDGFVDGYKQGMKDAQPERKKGKWIYIIGLEAFECSVCGRQMVRNIFDYCPWCGADMRKD